MIKNKIVSLSMLKEEVKQWQRQGLKVVFTNGCFDILHIGHVHYLESAKKCGDKLIVAINSDSSTREIKDKTRPVVPEKERAQIIAALECVDRVTIFNELTPLSLIAFLKPDVLVKGADWPEDKIVGRDMILSMGGEVKRIAIIKGISTTKIIERILKKYKRE
jgi:D-beta-D-heptose 7-phosphate kinase/D-beta-D-heptose 1-phosphate adenosyltransferase